MTHHSLCDIKTNDFLIYSCYNSNIYRKGIIYKRNNVCELYDFLKPEIIKADDAIIARAESIMRISSIKAFGSLHLACAEAHADILLTTDIKFLKAANNLKTEIKVKNPIDFLWEVDENNNAVSKK